MLHLERNHPARRAGWISLVGVLVVPLLVAGGFLWATLHSDHRLDTVQAAVVNLDKPITLNGQLVPLGRQLAGGLVNGKTDVDDSAESNATNRQQNFTWVLSDTADASDGLASGKYAAVVTIPKSFSADATSYAKNDADQAQHATLDVQTSEVAGVTDPAIAQAITSTAVSTLNRQLTEQYLKNIYIGFNTTGKQFTSVANGAKKLSDGASSLSTGISKTSDGVGSFASGLHQLDSGTHQLATGVSKTSDGVGSFASGLHKLDSGAQQLSGGVSSVAGGTSKLADGLGQAATGSKKLASGAGKLDDGLASYAGGAGTYAAGVKTYAAGVATYAKQGKTLAAGASAYSAGVGQAYQGLQQATTQQLDAVCAQAGISRPQCAAVKQATSGIQTAVFKGDGTAKNPGLIGGAVAVSTGVGQYTGAAATLSAGAGKLSAGGSKLAGGVEQLSGGLHSLSGGVSSLSGGLGQSASGARQLAAGVGKLDTGAAGLASGTHQSAQGADKLAAGVAKLSTGAAGLADGTRKSANGADQLASGVVKLDDGASQLADGAKKLSDGLAKGAKQIPTYSSADRTALSSVVATPVKSAQPDTLFSDQTTTTLLAVLALWLGGLVSYLIFRAVSSRAFGSSKSSLRLALEGIAPGAAIAAVQAIVLSVVLGLVLDLSAGQVAETMLFGLFAAVTFAAINHALVAWFGGVGRFLSAVALVLVAAGALTSALPDLLQNILPVLPLTPALDGLRAIVTGGSGLGHASVVLFCWLVVAAAASVVAVTRRRMLPAGARLVPVLT